MARNDSRRVRGYRSADDGWRQVHPDEWGGEKWEHGEGDQLVAISFPVTVTVDAIPSDDPVADLEEEQGWAGSQLETESE